VTAFSGIDIARTGAGFSKYWLDTIAHNIANVNTVRAAGEEPFRARLVVAQAQTGTHFAATGSGVGVSGVLEDQADAPRVQDPTNPLADEQGYVTQPVIDMAGQMTDLIVAQRSYQANLRAVETAKEAYQSALRIGQR
jgi:flagellar basal-body rod protein FlgC